MTTHTMTKLLRAASAASVLALVPGLATAQSASAEAATQQFVLTAMPSASLLEVAPGARAAPAHGSDVGQLALGGSLGFGAGDFTTVFKLNGDVQYTLSEISPRVYFDLAGHVGIGFGSSTILFEVVPKARIRYALDNKLSFYGDGGFGFALWHVSVDFPGFPPFIPPSTISSTNGYALLRFSGGIQYKVTPTVILVGEPVGLNIYLGSGTGFQYSFMVGALFKV